ncbi:uncharacterized protein PV07_08600 [Cladophialophora immunda]|uniref:Uncharacterized protein n=1 Tax=Cladophialophora immunda TaxID=569365 RepID=A0A0D2AKD8_9EURO|nr:uncharacterized protein PV07_08600 [Cladophialophora immunda]KIW25427.1 hypothetical protein PV07_08600 [Cladophialophora immunda]OQV09554.1 hypothetical protein CLAIMM_13662 [Cladophialophora immunda]
MNIVSTGPVAYFQGRIDHMLHCSFLYDRFARRLLASLDAIDPRKNHVVVVQTRSLTRIDSGGWHDCGVADTGFHHFDRPLELAGNGPVSVRLAYMKGLLFMAMEYPDPDRGKNPFEDESITRAYGPSLAMLLLQRMWDTYDSLSLLLWLYPADLPPELPPDELLTSWAKQLAAVNGALRGLIATTGAEYIHRRDMEAGGQDDHLDDMYGVHGLLHDTDRLLDELQSQRDDKKLSTWASYRDHLDFIRNKLESTMYFIKTGMEIAENETTGMTEIRGENGTRGWRF